DLVISLSAYDNNADPLSFRVHSIPEKGTLYQFGGGQRGAKINVGETIVSDSHGRVIFAPEAGEFGIPYASFTFVANDGEVDSSPAQITVNIIRAAPVAFTQSETSVSAHNAKFHRPRVPIGLPSTI